MAKFIDRPQIVLDCLEEMSKRNGDEERILALLRKQPDFLQYFPKHAQKRYKAKLRKKK